MPSLQLLCEFAEKTSREIEYTENPYPDRVLNKAIKYGRTFYILNNTDKQCYYAGFSDGKRVDEHAIYCGVFIPIDLPTNSKLKIRKKDILDKLNPFLKSNSFSTGY